MPGKNTLGTHNTEDYNLGRGKVYLAELDSSGKPQGFRDVGNVPEFTVTVDSETLPHNSTRRGLQVVDKEVVLSQALNISCNFDSINHENMSNFFSGETADYTNGASATEYTMPAAENSGPGFWYELKDSSGNRIYDVASMVFNSTDHGIAGVEDTDFVLNKAMGLVFIPTTTNLTNVSASDTLKYTVTRHASALTTIDEVRALTKTNVAVALKFVSENPASNDLQSEYQFHKISLKAEGDFALISDEWTGMGFQGAAEENEAAGGTSSPTLTIRTFSGGGAQ